MDAYSEDLEYYKSIYQSFVDFLRGTSADDSFTEEELIDVFDYAGDLADGYVQNEVLFYAKANYPKSRRLKERLALYYLAIENEQGALQVANSLPQSSFLGRLIKLRLAASGSDNELAQLNSIIQNVKPASLMDEEVIQLASALSAIDRIDWMKEHIDSLKKLCEYPSTLIYELVQLLISAGRAVEAKPFAQELTMLEPFNFDFWSCLAEIDGEFLGEYEQALQSLEFALAINPEAKKEIVMRAHYLSRLRAPFSEIEKELDRALRITPDDYDLMLYKASVLNEYGFSDKALSTLDACIDKVVDKRGAILLLCHLCQESLPEWLTRTRLWNLFTDFDLEELTAVVKIIFEFNLCDAVLTIIEGVPTDVMQSSAALTTLYASTLYRQQRYPQVIRFIESITNGDIDVLAQRLDLALIYALSKYNLGDESEAGKFIKKIQRSLSFQPQSLQIDSLMSHLGYSRCLLMLRVKIEGQYPVDRKEFDPYFSKELP